LVPLRAIWLFPKVETKTVLDGNYDEKTMEQLSGVKVNAAQLGPLDTWIPV